MNDLNKDIAELVKRHRKQAKLTQKALGELAGVGKTAVFDVEKSKATVRFQTLQRILNTLNISLELRSPLLAPKGQRDA